MKINLKSLLIICCSVFITFTVATDAKASTSKVRLGGKDRYETAIQISKAGWVDKSKSVVLATGQDFPDALCAAPLAKKLGAPILLNIKSKLLPEVEQELKRLNVEEIIIVGGPGVISDDVLNTLNAMNIKCTRIYGANRYETSIKVAQQLDKSTEIAVATGDNFPDAISISSIAAQKGMPFCLLGKIFYLKV
ncbi:cell wall-binding repeat-containing protein [Clostridium sp.]